MLPRKCFKLAAGVRDAIHFMERVWNKDNPRRSFSHFQFAVTAFSILLLSEPSQSSGSFSNHKEPLALTMLRDESKQRLAFLLA